MPFPGTSTSLQARFSKVDFRIGFGFANRLLGYNTPLTILREKGSKVRCNFPTFPEMGRAKRKGWRKESKRLQELKKSCWILSSHLQRITSSKTEQTFRRRLCKKLLLSNTPENLLLLVHSDLRIKKPGGWKTDVCISLVHVKNCSSELDPMALLVAWLSLLNIFWGWSEVASVLSDSSVFVFSAKMLNCVTPGQVSFANDKNQSWKRPIRSFYPNSCQWKFCI